jgi:hypothetical protein
MRYRPGALAVVGSNPTGPTELSVQILQRKKKNISANKNNKNLKLLHELPVYTRNHEMRDLYHRQDRLMYWIERVNTDLQEPDKTDILKLVEDMQDRERAVLWIVRCVTALLLLRKQLQKPFRNATKDDPRHVLKWMEEKGYKASKLKRQRT